MKIIAARPIGKQQAAHEIKQGTVLHLRRTDPAKMTNMVPAHVWNLAAPYGLTPAATERTGATDAGADAADASGGDI